MRAQQRKHGCFLIGLHFPTLQLLSVPDLHVVLLLHVLHETGCTCCLEQTSAEIQANLNQSRDARHS